MKIFIQIAVILAIVTAGISPACAFVSGKTSWIEICGADGGVHKIAVSADLDPLAQGSDDARHDTAQDQCGFCLTHANGKTIKPVSITISKPLAPSYIAVSAGTYLPVTMRIQKAQPRAPPFFS